MGIYWLQMEGRAVWTLQPFVNEASLESTRTTGEGIERRQLRAHGKRETGKRGESGQAGKQGKAREAHEKVGGNATAGGAAASRGCC